MIVKILNIAVLAAIIVCIMLVILIAKRANDLIEKDSLDHTRRLLKIGSIVNCLMIAMSVFAILVAA